MKKIRLFAVGILMLSSLFLSCGGGSQTGGGSLLGGAPKSPKGMTETFWKMMEKKEYEKAADYFVDNVELASGTTAERKAEIRKDILQFFEWGGNDYEKDGGISKVEASETISDDGKTANVDVKVTLGNGKTKDHTDPYYKDADGNWRMGDTVMK